MYQFAGIAAVPRAHGYSTRPMPDVATPFFTLKLDASVAIIRATTIGFWSVETVVAYITQLERFVVDSQNRFGRAKVLVDRRQTPIQAPDVADRLGKLNGTLYRSDDRLALVVDSNLAKGQMRRRFVHEGSKAFLSYEAAETWLNAWP